MIRKFILSLLYCITILSAGYAQTGFSLVEQPDKKKVRLLYDGKLLTAYCYFDSTEKPILFPVNTLSGIVVTRGFPIVPRPGERTDHPHHVGIWFNYESVNGLDFWNNSASISAKRKYRYGSIRHQKVLSSSAKKDKANLQTLSHWVDSTGQVLLEEVTDFTFTKNKNSFIIDRTATLTAKVQEVLFKDVKDGMIAIRVARELELPSKEKSKFIDSNGIVTEVPPAGTDNVTGMYVNREGLQGDAVWGKRSAWAYITGKKDGESVTIAIIDHPSNPGYPTYWHARGYGLFAANPLGQKIFSNGKEELNYKLLQGQSGKFSYRVVIHSGSGFDAAEADRLMKEFTEKNKTVN